jgi:NAD(P)-dependent dehydrogenase (short-subunit alcohol dehydrogenase family)
MKYVIVTGAYGGMGYAAVRAFRDKGYYVFALDRRVGKAEEGVTPIEVDLTSVDEIESAYAKVRDVTDNVYAIAHFAGMYNLDSLVEMSEKDFTRIFDVNVFSVYRVNKIFLPLLTKGSRILITTSELAPLDPLPFTGIYAVTKAALDKYAYSLRMELQLLGISVSVLRPGAVNTGMLGVSTAALDRFCEETKLYSCNAERFKRIVDGVEARNVKPEKVGKLALKILEAKRARQVYKINRNPLLLLLNVLPKRLATYIIKIILK